MLFKIFFVMFIYFWERERERVQAGEGQKERKTQNLKPTPGSELSAQSLTQASNSQTVRSWPEPKLDAQPTEPPRSPWEKWFLCFIFTLHYISTFVNIPLGAHAPNPWQKNQQSLLAFTYFFWEKTFFYYKDICVSFQTKSINFLEK